MNQLLERVRPLMNMNIPTEVLLMGLDRTTRYTDKEVGEAMRHVIKNADIGETTEEEITVVPLTAPSEVPAEPAVPSVPVEEPVPA